MKSYKNIFKFKIKLLRNKNQINFYNFNTICFKLFHKYNNIKNKKKGNC